MAKGETEEVIYHGSFGLNVRHSGLEKFITTMGLAFTARNRVIQLAELAQVPSRRIEQYEQRVRDINAARADAVLSLAMALNCDPRDLVERVPLHPALQNP